MSKKQWLELLGKSKSGEYAHSLELAERFSSPEYDGEIYLQSNGINTYQKVIMLLPKNTTTIIPGVVIPFYFPEAMMGYDIKSGETLEFYRGVEMMVHLVKRGYAVISGESYHLTYLREDKTPRDDFIRWKISAQALLADNPRWSGMGKLVADTSLLIDLLCADSRIDKERIGICGHSLGGKMAFYTGCLDERIKVILASDFGMGWESTNWDDIWYWGSKLKQIKASGLDHTDLLSAANNKPFCLLAGKYDTEESGLMMEKAAGYDKQNLLFINHATGHRPPYDALCKGYDFIDKYLK